MMKLCLICKKCDCKFLISYRHTEYITNVTWLDINCPDCDSQWTGILENEWEPESVPYIYTEDGQKKIRETIDVISTRLAIQAIDDDSLCIRMAIQEMNDDV